MNNDFPTSIDYNDWVASGCEKARESFNENNDEHSSDGQSVL